MKIYFFWPFKNQNKPASGSTESYEFYNALEKLEDIKLVESFDDFVIYMMALRNCPMPWHKVNELNMEILHMCHLVIKGLFRFFL